MAYEILYEDSFRRDYEQVVSYLSDVLHSPQAARNLIKRIREAAGLLVELPLIQAESNHAALRNAHFREHFVGSYVIIYHFDGTTVRFVRLFHQTQDYSDDWYWAE